MAPEMGHTPPRLGFKMRARPGGDRASRKSPDLGKNHGHPMGLRNGPFCKLITAEYCLNYGLIKGLWRRVEMAPEMGHTSPRLGFKMRARPRGDRMSTESPDFGEIVGTSWVSEMALSVS